MNSKNPQNAMDRLLSKRSLGIAASALAILALVVWALRAPPVAVDLVEVARAPMQVTADEEGKTRVKQVFVVSAPVAGKLRRSPLDVGDTVVRDETVIATIEPSAPVFLDVRARQEAEAQVAAARAAVALAEAEVRQAETEQSWAESELQRARSLVQTNVVSARTAERAHLELTKQQAALARAKASLQVRAAELATASAHLVGPETVSDQTPKPSCCVDVRSPQSGQVLRELQESERVVAAGTPLFEIGNAAELEIVVDLLSTDAVRIPPGAKAIVEGAGLPAPLEAKVRRIEPAAFTKVSALGIEEQRVRIILDMTSPFEAWKRLGHDYRVFVRIIMWSEAAALRIPLSALFRQGDKWAVYTAVNARAKLTLVEIGHRNNEVAEVRSGLKPGDLVVQHPSDRVTNDTRLAPRPRTN